MGRIKSALEIALEKTESIQSDKGSIGHFEAKQRGKKLAGEYLEGAVSSLEGEFKGIPKEELVDVKQGIFDVLISQVNLPVSKDDLGRIEKAGTGLHFIIGDKRFGDIVKQLVQMMNQFLEEAAHYDEALKQQYAPKLRQKEEEIARRLGRQVSLDPFQDPEFVSFYNQNINNLKDNYQSVITQVREEAHRLFEELDSFRN
ncbi:MAG: hypothetical protein FWH12_06185 [Treponema sp.]|nr:hypothetical protein [Treponema sp.]